MLALSGVMVSPRVVAENTRLKKNIYKGVILLNHLVTKKKRNGMEEREEEVNQNSRPKKQDGTAGHWGSSALLF